MPNLLLGFTLLAVPRPPISLGPGYPLPGPRLPIELSVDLPRPRIDFLPSCGGRKWVDDGWDQRFILPASYEKKKEPTNHPFDAPFYRSPPPTQAEKQNMWYKKKERKTGTQAAIVLPPNTTPASLRYPTANRSRLGTDLAIKEESSQG